MKTQALLLLGVLAMVCLAPHHVDGQAVVNQKFGNGFRVTAADSSFSGKFHTRIQTRYEGETYLPAEGDPEHVDRFRVRRARIKGDGWVVDPKFAYKFEYDMVNGIVLDAVVKWKFAPGFQLWFGQTKLPGNRERVISSQNMQFVDRSNLNGRFTLDRDAGAQLRHEWSVGDFYIREAFAFSQGEGLNNTSWSNGYGYTGRVELLPLGKFKGKGDYKGADLVREEKPKLAIALTYDFNQKAARSRGQMGSNVADSVVSDLSMIHADMMFKFQGWSLMAEYANRNVLDIESQGAYYTGSALNADLGYLLKSNWEFAMRYTVVTPDEEVGSAYSYYALGISKYMSGHNLKVQSDFGMTQTDGSDDLELLIRLQTEVAF